MHNEWINLYKIKWVCWATQASTVHTLTQFYRPLRLLWIERLTSQQTLATVQRRLLLFVCGKKEWKKIMSKRSCWGQAPRMRRYRICCGSNFRTNPSERRDCLSQRKRKIKDENGKSFFSRLISFTSSPSSLANSFTHWIKMFAIFQSDNLFTWKAFFLNLFFFHSVLMLFFPLFS